MSFCRPWRLCWPVAKLMGLIMCNINKKNIIAYFVLAKSRENLLFEVYLIFLLLPQMGFDWEKSKPNRIPHNFYLLLPRHHSKLLFGISTFLAQKDVR